MNIPRKEYPRPQFERRDWLNLNGEWEFSFDSDVLDRKIIVPYAYQTKLSGIDIQDFHDEVWYQKAFQLPDNMLGKIILLHFGAVDYECDVWVNDVYITHHTGGHISFDADITHAATENNVIKLRVRDCTADLEMPRGKQFWERQSSSCFYTRTTGIWQTVWIEAVNETYLSNVYITPDLDDAAAEFQYEITGTKKAELLIEISFDNETIAKCRIEDAGPAGRCKVALNRHTSGKGDAVAYLAWSPEKPRLFDVLYRIIVDGRVTDEVKAYFGLRKISIDNGIIMLNNRKYYQKLVLDQGYWKDSLLTAPADKDFIQDIRLCKEMGFNGARKHQKIEDPRYLYHADRMGFLVWGEIASAFSYSKKYVKRITNEWMDEILRDYNHPCIIVWTPLNESWGVFDIRTDSCEQNHSVAMVSLAKSLDPTRPVISNDGWEHTITDIFTIHDYDYDREILIDRYKNIESALKFTPAGKLLFARGYEYRGQPVILSECGGISKICGEGGGWGYVNADTEEEFIRRYQGVISSVMESGLLQGFCYTQLTDVEQEVNGLLTADRMPKVDTEKIKEINEGKWNK